MHLGILTITGLACMLPACVEMGDWGNSERFKEDFHSIYPLTADGAVSLENFNGGIEIFGWDQNSVEVNATKHAATKELLDALKIDVSAGSGSVRIRSIRPSASWHGNVGVQYTLHVPRHVQLDTVSSSNGAIRVEQIDGPAHLKTSNGAIRVFQVHGEVEARTSNGGIEVRELDGNGNLHTSNGSIRADAAHGSFEAQTSNGGIEATLVDAATNWPVRVHSSNGRVELTLKGARLPDVRAGSSNSSVTLRLPEQANARVHASTSHSSITSDFPVLTGGREARRHEVDGTIGTGGPMIELDTSNGSIKILKM